MIISFEKYVNNLSMDYLPEAWQIDLRKFSEKKRLYDFQKKALQNALLGLWMYYAKDTDLRAQAQYMEYINCLKAENHCINLADRQLGKATRLYLHYENDYPAVRNIISIENFSNRMGFWMATGSGKTLLIVKMIEILGRLKKEGQIPDRDIMFLAHREDLIEQFRNHVLEFNAINNEVKIHYHDLKSYNYVKNNRPVPLYKYEIDVFYYRSDLFTEERKEKQIDYRDYENGGNWYLVLDEAHKGGNKDKLQDSIRQALFTIISRKGYLFNFSATFTDRTDQAMVVYNYNLERFVQNGYAKHIYLSQSDVTAFRTNDDYSPIEKKKIVLKTLILLAYVIKNLKEIRKIDSKLYHKPLLVALVNSVNTEDSDLQMLFQELAFFANNRVDDAFFIQVKNELRQEFQTYPCFKFEGNNRIVLNDALFNSIDISEVFRFLYNSETPGKIELRILKNSDQEIACKLQTSDKPFALIKIGNARKFLEKMPDTYIKVMDYEDTSIFKNLNNADSDINFLFGSRAFYEGWDSNRPNIILFVNIGVGDDAKKFVLQSIGRGVRIEPYRNIRKRYVSVLGSEKATKEVYDQIKDLIPALETLCIFGTNSRNVNDIMETLKSQQSELFIGDHFEKNLLTKDCSLLIPYFTESRKEYSQDSILQKFPIHQTDYLLVSDYYNSLYDKNILIEHECSVFQLAKLKDMFSKPEHFFDTSYSRQIGNPSLIMKRMLDFVNVSIREFDKYKELEDEIIHFKKVALRDAIRLEALVDAIGKVKRYPFKEEKNQQLLLDFEAGSIRPDELVVQAQEIGEQYKESIAFTWSNSDLNVKYVKEHYYLPVVTVHADKADILSHIINTPSEIKFIQSLEEYIKESSEVMNHFDWWFFSKLDPYFDKVFIPYYNPMTNSESKFNPDFVFWFKKGEKYRIVFVDPKGVEHSYYQLKADGFKQAFYNKKHPDGVYQYNSLQIKPLLYFYTQGGAASIGEAYRDVWVISISDLIQRVVNSVQY